MPSCAVYGCTNYSQKTKGTEIRYFRFPRTEIAKEWINSCGRNSNFNTKHACVCSIHFDKESFEVPLRQRLLNYNPVNSRHLKPTAVPTEHLPKSTPATEFLFVECGSGPIRLQTQPDVNNIKLEMEDDDQTEVAVLKMKFEDIPEQTGTLKEEFEVATA